MRFIIALMLCLPAGLWGYQLSRAGTNGQFRRRGYPGWLERSDHPAEFNFAFACNLVCFGAVVAAIVRILFFTTNR